MYYGWDGQPISQEEWLAGFAEPRHVDRTDLGKLGDVSTVWLGLDHRFGSGPPLIFETMVFGGPEDQYQERYSTAEQARQGHEAVVIWLVGMFPVPRPARKQLIHKGGKP
jgi:hypothetical protein